MKWFYQNEGREFGPLSETALQELHAGGAITDETPVRREDSVGWQPCAIAFSQTPNAQQQPAHSSNQHLFKFECPHCQQHISTDEDCSGQPLQCPTCSMEFVVPSHTKQQGIQTSAVTEDKRKTQSKKGRIQKTGTATRGNRIKTFSVAALGLIIILVSIVLLSKRGTSKKSFNLDTSASEKQDPLIPVSPIPELEAELKPLRASALAGDYEAMFEIGRIFMRGLRGNYMPGNDGDNSEKAEVWFQRAETKCGADGRGALSFKVSDIYFKCGDDYTEKAMAWLLKSANYGYSESQLELYSKIYETDPEASIQWLVKAAQNGLIDAQSELGYIHFRGLRGVPKDIEKAEYWDRKAAEGGDAQAQAELAILIQIKLTDIKLKESLDKKQLSQKETLENEFVYWLERAANQNEVRAQFILGESYFWGSVKPNDQVSSYKWFLIVNTNRKYKIQTLPPHKEESLRIRIHRLEETLTTQQKTEAKARAAAFRALREPKKEGKSDADVPHADTSRHDVAHDGMDDTTRGLLKAAERGAAIPQILLAGRYSNGEGVDKNYELAAKWYQKAADQGNIEAQFQLGSLYLLGQGVAVDYNQAEKWLRKAADKGDAMSQYHLGNLYWEGLGVTKKQEEAIKWYVEAAKQGNDRAQAKLGYAYLTGKGVPQDLHEAVEWLRKGAEQGNALAQGALGACYGVGDGVTQDDVTAYMWANLSALSGAENGIKVRQMLTERMTREDIERARRKTQEWLDKHKEINHRLSADTDVDDASPGTNAFDSPPGKDAVNPSPDTNAVNSDPVTVETLPALQVFKSGTLDEAKESIRMLDEQLKNDPENARVKLVRSTIMDVFRAEASLIAAITGQKDAEKQYQIKMQNLQIASRPSPLTGKVNTAEVERIRRDANEIKSASESKMNAAKADLRKSLDSAERTIPAADNEFLSRVWSKIETRNNL